MLVQASLGTEIVKEQLHALKQSAKKDTIMTRNQSNPVLVLRHYSKSPIAFEPMHKYRQGLYSAPVVNCRSQCRGLEGIRQIKIKEKGRRKGPQEIMTCDPGIKGHTRKAHPYVMMVTGECDSQKTSSSSLKPEAP
jgi:hypothetical protein